MSKNKKLVPKRRFNRFEKDKQWFIEKLSSFAEFSKGNGYSKNDLCEQGLPILLYGRLYTQYETIIRSVDTFIINKKDSTVFSSGDEVVVPASGETAKDIARASFIHKSGIIIGGDLNIIKPKDKVISHFLAISLSSGDQKKELIKRAQGKTVVHLHNSDLKDIKFIFPTKKEQTQIGEFFKKLDTLIQTQQKKLEKTKTLKSAYLAEIFPCDGELKPKLQFKDFINDWYSIKLGKVGHAISGIGFPNSEQGGLDGIPFYKVSDMNNAGNEREMKHANNYVTSEQIFIRRWNTIKTLPAIIFAKVGAAIMLNRKRIIKTECIIDNNMMAYIFDHTWDVNFGKVLFETINLPRYAQVGALPSYNSTDIENIDTKVPNKDEQTKIGNFFKLLDKKIALEQRKLEKLNNIKQAYLNEMFV